MRTLKYGVTCFLAATLFLLGCADHDLDVAPASVAETADAATLQQWFEQQLPQRRGAPSPAPWAGLLQWNGLETWVAEGSRVYAVALTDPRPNHFANSALKGDRRLVIWTDRRGQRQANLVEVYRQNAEVPTGEPLRQLLNGLVTGLRDGRDPAPDHFSGMAVVYTLGYAYRSGYVFQDGRVTGHYRVRYTYTRQATGQRGATQSLSSTRFQSTLAQRSSCGSVIVCEEVCGTVTAGSGGGPGNQYCTELGCTPAPTNPVGGPGGPVDPTSGGWGGAGTGPGSGGAGGPANPKMVSRMPTSMPTQVGGGCVPASLAIIKSSLCGGSYGQNQNAIGLYGTQQYGVFFMNNGVPLADMGSFVDHFFNVDILMPAGNFMGAIDNGYPILIDKFSYSDGTTDVYHSVVVTGYDQNDQTTVYYLDPATGSLSSGDGPTLFANSHYAIPVTGCH